MTGWMDEIRTATECARGSSAPRECFFSEKWMCTASGQPWLDSKQSFFSFPERYLWTFCWFFFFFECEGQFMKIKRKDPWTLNDGEAFIKEQRSLTLSWFLHSDAQHAFCFFCVAPESKSKLQDEFQRLPPLVDATCQRWNTGRGETYLRSFFCFEGWKEPAAKKIDSELSSGSGLVTFRRLSVSFITKRSPNCCRVLGLLFDWITSR